MLLIKALPAFYSAARPQDLYREGGTSGTRAKCQPWKGTESLCRL